MKILLMNESSIKSTKSDSETMTSVCRHASVHKSLGAGERFELTWTFNFSDMTIEGILDMAAEHCIIKERRIMSKISKPESFEWDDVTFNAADLITVRLSKVDRAAKAIAAFSDEELEALGLTRVKK